MKVSVVIPTWRRKQELIDTVGALTKQSTMPYEIIVVDQNEPEIVEVTDFLAKIPQVKHVRGCLPGVVPNYNRCLKEASGEIILFIDDDVIPKPQLIEKHLKNYSDDPAKRLGAVAGRILNRVGDCDPSKVNRVGKYFPITGKVIAQFNGLERKFVDFGQGANMSFRRQALLEIGGFDPKFDGNGYFFETDAGLRLQEKGYSIVFDPEAELDHLVASSGGARVNDKALHAYHFEKNGLRLYRRHSMFIGLPIFLARQIFHLIAKSVYNLNPWIFIKGVQGLIAGMN